MRFLILGALALITGGFLLLLPRSARASVTENPEVQSENGLSSFSWRGVVYGDANLAAFLALIRRVEAGTDSYDYDDLYGGGNFSDFSDHPAALGWRGVRLTNGLKSTAAGAYQITFTTWQNYKDEFGITDFSPESQDKFAVRLIQKRGALEDVKAGRFLQALQKCRNEWESFDKILRGSYFVDVDQAQQIFIDNGGIPA